MNCWRDIFRRKYASIVTVLLAGLCMRLIGIGFGLPFLYHPDEHFLVEKAMQFGTGDLNPRFFEWPASIVMYMLFGSYVVYYLILNIFGAIEHPADFAIRFWEDPTLFYLIARSLTAVFSTGAIYLTYKIAKETYGKKQGIWASLLVAFGYQYVRDSRYAAPDMYMICFLLGSVLFFERYFRRREMKSLILAGVLWGLATASKYPAALLVFTGIASVCLKEERTIESIERKYFKMAGALGLVTIVAIATFIAATPFAVMDYRTFFRDVVYQRSHVLRGHIGFEAQYSSYAWFFSNILPEMMGFVPSMVLIAGSFFCLMEKNRVKWVVGMYPVALYLLVLGQSKTFFIRYAFPVMPFMSIWGGHLLVCMTNKLNSNTFARSFILVALGISLVVVPLGRAGMLGFSLLSTDTRTEALSWIKRNISSGEKIGLESFTYCPQIENRGQYLKRYVNGRKWIGKYFEGLDGKNEYELVYIWNDLKNPSIELLRALKVKYIVLSSSCYERYFTNYALRRYKHNSHREFYMSVMNSLRLLREFRQPGYLAGDPYHSPTIRICLVE